MFKSFFNFVFQSFLNLFIFIDGYVGNKSITIIIVAILLRLILFPFSANYTKFTTSVKKLDPEIKRIREQEKDLAKAEMKISEIYKREGVSPFSGLLYIALQIFLMISSISVIRSQSFVGADDLLFGFKLVERDPYYILPIISTLVFFVNMPRSNPSKGISEYALVGIMFFVNMRWSIALLLFFTTNSVVSLAQDFLIKRFSLNS